MTTGRKLPGADNNAGNTNNSTANTRTDSGAAGREFLGTEPVGKLLFRLAVPSVTAQLINMLYNVVDRIYIGHMPEEGALALTGVGVCMPLILIISAFASLVSSGGAPKASIFMGRKENDTAEHILGNCFTLLLFISVVLTAFLLVFHRPLLLLFGASENTIGYASDYMRIYALGTIFVQLTLGMNMFITAQGFAGTGMLTVLIGAICNIILDPVLIYIFDMGVRGAALATIISQGISCTWCLLFLCGKKTQLRIRKEYFPLRNGIILPCVALGFATFLMQSSESILAICFNSSLLKYGGDIAVGAMTICTSVMQFALLPLQGIGQGAQPITSYNYGAGNTSRVKEIVFLLLKICVSYSVLLYAAVMLFPRGFASIFSEDAALLDYAVHALRIYCGALFLFGIQIACQLTFTAIGNAVCSVIVATVRKFVLLIPLIYIVPLFVSDKAKGVFMAEPIADLIAVTFTAILFYFQFKKVIAPKQ